MERFWHTLLIAMVGLLSISVLTISVVVLRMQRQLNELSVAQGSSSTSESVPSVASDPQLQNLQAKVTQLESEVDTLSARLATTQTGSTTTTKSAQKEYNVFLGDGASSDTNWVTQTATTFTFNPQKYQNISAVYFEGGLSIASGQAFARLINTKTGAVLFSSQIVHDSSTVTIKRSQFTPENGENTYAIQLRSSSDELAQITGARIRIIAD